MDSKPLGDRVADTPPPRRRQRSVLAYCMDEGGRRRALFSPVAGTRNLHLSGERHTRNYASLIR
jgi:hypothetical protein